MHWMSCIIFGIFSKELSFGENKEPLIFCEIKELSFYFLLFVTLNKREHLRFFLL